MRELDYKIHFLFKYIKTVEKGQDTQTRVRKKILSIFFFLLFKMFHNVRRAINMKPFPLSADN